MIGAVDMVVFGDGCVVTQQEFGPAFGLVGEVTRVGAGGETCDPVAATD